MKSVTNLFLKIIVFAILLYFYATITSLILYFLAGLIIKMESSGWLMCIMIGFVTSPIFTYITIKRIFNTNINITKILFSDYDNTLYRNEEEILENIKYINEFIKKGNKFVIASGRSYGDLLPELKKYNIPFHYLICDDGATIYNKNIKILYSSFINDNVSKGIYILIKNNEHIITKKIYDIKNKTDEYINNCIKMNFVFNNKEECFRIKKIIDTNFGNSVNTYLSEKIDTISLEIISKKTNKGNGVKIVSKLCNINKNNIFVIGDNNNDIEMVKEYNGYSISTGIEELKKVSKKSYNSVNELIKEIL